MDTPPVAKRHPVRDHPAPARSRGGRRAGAVGDAPLAEGAPREELPIDP